MLCNYNKIYMFTRQKTRKVMVGNVQIGHQNNVVIQSMTNTKTSDISKTLKQISALHTAGCELVRVSVLDQNDVKALKIITKKAPCPIVADIHYSDKFAIESIKAGVAKIRINPGNIPLSRLKEVVAAAKKCKTAIRIGVNAGSFNIKTMTEEAVKYIKQFES
ncbi:hypothetical protein FACS1894166_07050 [Bacilli bacterium]|nr:hypothetical protein FACS1894166_07050 [Bacilli bacterium]